MTDTASTKPLLELGEQLLPVIKKQKDRDNGKGTMTLQELETQSYTCIHAMMLYSEKHHAWLIYICLKCAICFEKT